MELVNASRYEAAYAPGITVSGREVLVVAVKGTFRIPESPEEIADAESELMPLNYADSFTGMPGDTAPITESDFVPVKHKCDVILIGQAYAPGGQPVNKVTVGLKVGSMDKKFNVVGERTWVDGTKDISRLPVKPFETMPISYDCAYGGIDQFTQDDSANKVFWKNPVGCGHLEKVSHKQASGIELPNTEELGRPIKNLADDYQPMSFGVIGRHWSPRSSYAGTYNDNWVKNVRPFLPQDFDEAFYQCAPTDQQIPFLEGGEEVELYNLNPSGHTRFRIPKIDMPVTFRKRSGEKISSYARADTLVIEPDRNLFTITWRAHIELKTQLHEVEQAVVGKISAAWWRAQEQGKIYYPSLKDVVSPKDYTLEKD